MRCGEFAGCLTAGGGGRLQRFAPAKASAPTPWQQCVPVGPSGSALGLAAKLAASAPSGPPGSATTRKVSGDVWTDKSSSNGINPMMRTQAAPKRGLGGTMAELPRTTASDVPERSLG